MKEEKPIWILVPMRSEESKREFEKFVESKRGRPFKVPKQYQDGTVLLLTSPDLERFSTINYTCAASADFKTRGVKDFIENYDDFKRRYDIAMKHVSEEFQEVSIAKGFGTRFPKDLYFHKFEKKNHYELIMPDGRMVGIWTYKGEDDGAKIDAFYNNWFNVTSSDPEMFEHKVSVSKCPECGGEVHYKGNNSWCIKCHKVFRK